MVKKILAPDNPVSVLALHYQPTQQGWLPKSWTYSEYDERRLKFSEEIQVNKIESNPAFSDNAFTINLVAGMYVEEQVYSINPETEQYNCKSTYYLLAEGTGTTTLDENLYPAPPFSWRRWGAVLLASLALVAVMWALRRRRRVTRRK